MKTEITIEGNRFHINGRPAYEGRSWEGHSLEGKLFNSRMIQAVFDDRCPATRSLWAYPDTGAWDPDRNTDEFCRRLPEYRRHGLLAVTVGLQGGGSIYTPNVYDAYDNSAYEADGTFRKPYFDRLRRVLQAADEAEMVVIVNYFYFKQVRRIPEDKTIRDITARVTEWLLKTGFRNILADLVNEANPFWKRPLFEPDNVHELIEIAQGTAVDGRRLPVSVSTGGGAQIPEGKWRKTEDFSLPHGNGCSPEQLTAKLKALKETPEHQARPRPVAINEDSIFVENLEAAVRADCSWGFYCQGYGSHYKDRTDWTAREREERYEDLSGYQTLPVNWSINTPVKKAFFNRLREITGGLGK